LLITRNALSACYSFVGASFQLATFSYVICIRLDDSLITFQTSIRCDTQAQLLNRFNSTCSSTLIRHFDKLRATLLSDKRIAFNADYAD